MRGQAFQEPDPAAGFTLIEALMALAIVAMVVTSTLAWRTGALIDATEARNWRVAREVAQEVLSELRAGARETPPVHGMPRKPIPKMREVEVDPRTGESGWAYQIVIGETNIGQVEGEIESENGEEDLDEGDRNRADRREFQKERDDMRKARQKGVSYYEYRDQARLEEDDRLEREEVPPSEDEFEDVAVFVFFPNPRWLNGHGGKFSHFVLKARLSTLALEGLTPEEAESEQGSDSSDSNSSGGSAEATGGKGN